jgi:hypothetical protein
MIRATDSTSPTAQTASRSFTIAIGAQLAIQTNSLATGVVNTPYSQALAAAGGTLSYAWSVETGPLPPGLVLGVDGTLTGTPTAAGATTFVVRVTDSTSPAPETATHSFTIYVVGQITIDTIALPDATAAHPYAQALNAHSGIQPYVWTLSTGTLPPGIALLATGALIGTPSVAGTYSFTLKASDSTAPTPQTATQTYTLTVDPAFTITTTALPGASTGLPYSASIQAADGVTPYSFAVVFGALPPGLTLSAAGQITGTPTKPGIYNMLIRATDSTAPTAQTCDRPLSLTVDSTLTITTPALPDGTEGVQYTNTLTALNGLQPYTWSVNGGALPDGLSLLLSGTIVGIPTKPGIFHVTIQATDSSQPTPAISTRAYTLTIAAPLTITNATLPNGLTGSPYVNVFTTTGGLPQYIYSLTDGTLPPGLTLSQIGVIQGTPTTAGSFTFTVQVSDSSLTPSSVTRTYTVAINQPLNITTLGSFPPATLNTLYTLQLDAMGGLTPYTWSTLSTLPAGVQLLPNGILIGVPTQTGSYQLTFHLSDATPQTASLTGTLTVTPPLTITPTPFPPILPSVPYSAAAQATGGVAPYAWSVAGGSLPPGLMLNADGTLAGVTTASGSYDVQLTVTDSATTQSSATQEFVLLVAAPFAVTTTSPVSTALLGRPYSTTLAIAGGKSPYTWSIAGGSLPSGVTLSNSGTLSGTPTAAGTATFVVQCQDGANETAIKPLTLLVQPPLGIVTTAIPAIVAHTAYFHLFESSFGTAPFHWAVVGSLPDGVILTDGGLLTGTGVTPGSYPVTITVTDTSSPAPQSASSQITLTVIQALTAVTQAFTAYTGVSFSQTLTATGGTTPYSWAPASGLLPPGLTLTNNTISGTPTKAGQYSVVFNVTDATGLTAAGLYTFSITQQLAVPIPSLPSGTAGVSYAAVVSAYGGTSPYSWNISSGSLPAGLTMSQAGVISGTPTATGSFPFTAVVTDALGQMATREYTIQIQAAPAGLTIPPASVALPPGFVGTAYTASLTVTGGTAPYTWALAKGASLPSGCSLNGPAIIGTPTAPGTYTFALTVHDAAGLTTGAAYVLTVNAGLTITTATLPTATQGVPYTTALTAGGGVPPYTWSGTLLFGMNLSSAGVISGTPNLQGSALFTVTVSDSGKPGASISKTYTFAVGQALKITTTNPAPLTVGTAASVTLQTQGGLPPYTWNLTGGLLPPGLALSAAGQLSGTPTKSGAYLTTVQVTDSYTSPLTATAQVLFSVLDPLSVASATLPTGTAGTAYSAVLQAQGGTPPYGWSVVSGSLPNGLALSGNAISGTPTTSSTSTVVVKVSDAVGGTATQSLKLIVAAPFLITTINLPTGTTATAYTYALQASGGTAPYTWTLAPGSTLAAGTTLNAAGVLSGTPTAAGTNSFVVKVVDSGAPQQSATAALNLTVTPSLAITAATPPQATATLLYRFAFSADGGLPPYSWRVSAGVLPIGLVLTSAGILTGTPTMADTQQVTIQVTDSQNQLASGVYRLVVGSAPVLTLRLAPVAGTLDPLTQQAVQLTLASPYPLNLTGHVTLATADPDAALLQNGVSVRDVAFTVATGSTTANFPAGAVLLQSGTSAQPFTLTATTDSPQQTTSQQYSLLPLPPRLTSGVFTMTPSGFSITLHGFSTTREVQTATFRFYSKDTSSAPYTMAVTTIFQAWYSTTAAAGTGVFLYQQPFTMTGLGAITSVDITLTNSVGTSSPITLTPEAN